MEATPQKGDEVRNHLRICYRAAGRDELPAILELRSWIISDPVETRVINSISVNAVMGIQL